MKKTYIAPNLNVVTLVSPQLLTNASIEYGGGDGAGTGDENIPSAESKAFEGGFLWEDEK